MPRNFFNLNKLILKFYEKKHDISQENFKRKDFGKVIALISIIIYYFYNTVIKIVHYWLANRHVKQNRVVPE